MPDALLLVLAFAAALCGMAWLALAMDVHWQQARATDAPAPGTLVTALRVLGTLALAGSLALCLSADHPSMASLVWVLIVTASALLVAFTLSWRPGVLAPLSLQRRKNG